MIQTLLSRLVLGVALLVGFRPTADPAEWIAVIGLIGYLWAKKLYKRDPAI